MDDLTLKLVVTPALIGAATLAGRRWGQIVATSPSPHPDKETRA